LKYLSCGGGAHHSFDLVIGMPHVDSSMLKGSRHEGVMFAA